MCLKVLDGAGLSFCILWWSPGRPETPKNLCNHRGPRTRLPRVLKRLGDVWEKVPAGRAYMRVSDCFGYFKVLRMYVEAAGLSNYL